MGKTYRSLFLTCGACKSGVESKVKYCKYCGKAIWLKDVDTTPPISKETPEQVTESVDALVNNLHSLQRKKLQNELGKWLPTIFQNYYVVPNPMPKTILDFLVQNMGKELAYNMNIFGFGFDSLNNRFFVFDDNAVYYKAMMGDGVLYKIAYVSIKELTAGNGQLIIKTESIGTKYLSVFREREMAELLSVITGAKLNLYENNIATGVAENGMLNSGAQINRSQPFNNQPFNNQPVSGQSLKGQPSGAVVQKANYTVKDYIRDNPSLLMGLMMLGTRISLAVQCFVSFSYGVDTSYALAQIHGVLFGVFAFVLSYHRPWLMVICWFYCGAVSDDSSIGTAVNQGEWYGAALTFLTIAMICRFIIGRKYKKYMASVNK